MRFLLATLVSACAALAATGEVAAQVLTIQGRVVSAEDRTALPGISVTVTGRSFAVTTDDQGRFRLTDLTRGRYTVSAEGVGYEATDTVINLAGNTTIEIRLKRAPIALAPLNVRVRDVTVRGDVRERANEAWVIDAVVFGSPDRKTKVNEAGRFKFSKVPSGVPFTLRVESFSFLPYELTFDPQNDTTLLVQLDADPVIMKMIANLQKNMDERSDNRRYRELPVIERGELLKARDEGLFLDFLNRKLGTMVARRMVCLVLDEDFHPGLRPGDPLGSDRAKLETMLVDEVYRVEVINLPGGSRPIMVRAYTRDFMQNLLNGRKKLVERRQAMDKLGGQCR